MLTRLQTFLLPHKFLSLLHDNNKWLPLYGIWMTGLQYSHGKDSDIAHGTVVGFRCSCPSILLTWMTAFSFTLPLLPALLQ
jgi:hypothetical protein